MQKKKKTGSQSTLAFIMFVFNLGWISIFFPSLYCVAFVDHWIFQWGFFSIKIPNGTLNLPQYFPNTETHFSVLIQVQLSAGADWRASEQWQENPCRFWYHNVFISLLTAAAAKKKSAAVLLLSFLKGPLLFFTRSIRVHSHGELLKLSWSFSEAERDTSSSQLPKGSVFQAAVGPRPAASSVWRGARGSATRLRVTLNYLPECDCACWEWCSRLWESVRVCLQLGRKKKNLYVGFLLQACLCFSRFNIHLLRVNTVPVFGWNADTSNLGVSACPIAGALWFF